MSCAVRTMKGTVMPSASSAVKARCAAATRRTRRRTRRTERPELARHVVDEGIQGQASSVPSSCVPSGRRGGSSVMSSTV